MVCWMARDGATMAVHFLWVFVVFGTVFFRLYEISVSSACFALQRPGSWDGLWGGCTMDFTILNLFFSPFSVVFLFRWACRLLAQMLRCSDGGAAVAAAAARDQRVWLSVSQPLPTSHLFLLLLLLVHCPSLSLCVSLIPSCSLSFILSVLLPPRLPSHHCAHWGVW